MADTILSGLRIVEMQGIGPGPFCGMHFADLGAEVIVIERPNSIMQATAGITRRGKRSIVLDLKNIDDLKVAKALIKSADGLIEGNRPGVMERLGLSPDAVMADNPKLVYGRLTGWGQTGPLSQAAGHDINYAALAGALYFTGSSESSESKPIPTPTLTADIAGGAHYLMIGMLAALLKAQKTGVGDVVDAAMVDGTAHMMNLLLDVAPTGLFPLDRRGEGLLDGPHWYNAYACSCGNFFTVGALEPQFYALFLQIAGLDLDADFKDQMNKKQWPAQAEKLAALFKTKTRDQWTALFEGSDACTAPVLNPIEAAAHPHNQARAIYDDSKGYLQANPAPRFASTPFKANKKAPKAGEDTESLLKELGMVLY